MNCKSMFVWLCLWMLPARLVTAQWQVTGNVQMPKSMAVDTDGVVYVGAILAIWKSTDSAKTWQVLTDSLDLTDCFSIAVNPTNNHLFIAVESGVYRTVDGGAHWTFLGQELVGAYSLAARSDGFLVAAGSSGVYRSFDGGDTWDLSLSTIGPTNNGLSFSASGAIFVATLLDGLYRSTDDGDSWQFVGASFADPGLVLDVVCDALNGIVFATDYHMFLNDPVVSRVYRSLDDGTTWSRVDSADGLTQTLCVDTYQNVITGSAPVSLSSDHGNSWTDISSGLAFEDRFTRVIEVHPGLLLGCNGDGLKKLALPAVSPCCTGTTGDVALSGTVNSLDLAYLIQYLTPPAGPVLACPEEANVNGLGGINSLDLAYLIQYLTPPAGPALPACP